MLHDSPKCTPLCTPVKRPRTALVSNRTTPESYQGAVRKLPILFFLLLSIPSMPQRGTTTREGKPATYTIKHHTPLLSNLSETCPCTYFPGAIRWSSRSASLPSTYSSMEYVQQGRAEMVLLESKKLFATSLEGGYIVVSVWPRSKMILVNRTLLRVKHRRYRLRRRAMSFPVAEGSPRRGMTFSCPFGQGLAREPRSGEMSK